MNRAIIDMGTNTFHILVANKDRHIFKKSEPVKLGAGGIESGVILPGAMERAKKTLGDFKKIADSHGVAADHILAFGTSAMRNAGNSYELIDYTKQVLGFNIHVIDGNREAELIFKGVSSATNIKKTSMVVDIGGGSVEFIICNEKEVLWKRSFEIGGQRLMQRFMHTDPISYKSVEKMNDYFRSHLLPLANACHQYQPQVLIGSSGSFDTLVDMDYEMRVGHLPPPDRSSFDFELKSFYHWYELLLTRNLGERLEIPGMIKLRVEMIVVAVCLIRYLLQTFAIKEIKVSSYALKEGVLKEVFDA